MGSVDGGQSVNEHKQMSKNLRNDFAAAKNKGWSSVCDNSRASAGEISNDGHSPRASAVVGEIPGDLRRRRGETMADLLLVEQAGCGLVDVTVGSALDLFGDKGLCYKDLVA